MYLSPGNMDIVDLINFMINDKVRKGYILKAKRCCFDSGTQGTRKCTV